MKKNKQVSDLFIDIYLNFNVTKQTERMKQLTRRELILLLILSVDNFDIENEVTISTYTDFSEEIDIIYDMESDNEITDEVLLSLKEEFGSSFIDTTEILDKNNNKISRPLSEQEALVKRREIIINHITDK